MNEKRPQRGGRAEAAISTARHRREASGALHKVPAKTKVPSPRLVLVLGTSPLPLPFSLWGSKRGAAMWTSLLALFAAVLLPAIVVIGLFKLAALKRPDDLKAPIQSDEWASSHELQRPK